MTTTKRMLPFRAGFVAILGRPNVGKSTLVNALVGAKVAIVTAKSQTTRTRILGVVSRPRSQIVLADTPGLCTGRDALQRAMRGTAQTSVRGADVALAVIALASGRRSARGAEVLGKTDLEVLETAREGCGQVVVAVNKIDLLKDKRVLLPVLEALRQHGADCAIPVSAKTGDGLDTVLGELEARLPEGPAMFPEDAYTDQAERLLCAELVREQILLKTRDEVPHRVAVVIDSFCDDRKQTGESICRLEGRILVERESQKAIVVGQGGQQIKSISQAARQACEALLGCKVFLRLRVKVDRDWTRNERAVQRYGYGPGGES